VNGIELTGSLTAWNFLNSSLKYQHFVNICTVVSQSRHSSPDVEGNRITGH